VRVQIEQNVEQRAHAREHVAVVQQPANAGADDSSDVAGF
jgi:hypothetical protein